MKKNKLLLLFLIFIGFLSFVRIQLRKYLGLDIDWHLLFHLITLGIGLLAITKTFVRGRLGLRKIEISFLVIIFCFLFTVFFYLDKEILLTYWGIFEYIYIFLWSYFLSFFCWRKKDIKIAYNSFKILVFLMVAIALYQEIEYLLHKFGVIPYMIFSKHPPEVYRLGFLRPPSLVGGPTEWGSVALVYFLIELYLKDFKLSAKNLILIIAFLISVTRSLYLCFLSVAIFLILSKKRNLIDETFPDLETIKAGRNLLKIKKILLIFIIFGSFLLINIFVHNLGRKIDFLQGEGHLRGYAFYIAQNIENKLLGLGPGAFGSYVSFMLNSPYLSYYQSPILFDIQKIKTIDSFWLQIFIEMGIIGLVLNIFLFITFYKVMLSNFKKIDRKNKLIKSISFSCIFIPLIYAINGIGFTTFIQTYVIWTSLLSGIVWGYVKNSRERNYEIDHNSSNRG